jgi:hypothetical protein
LTRPIRFAAALATLALVAGGSSALADNGGGGHGGNDNHGVKHDARQDNGKQGRHGGNLLRSDLFGSQPLGPTLFGVAPGGKPWVLRHGEARVRRDGRIEVRVRGLVIPADPPTTTVASNPLPALAATLVCNGAAVGTTAPAPFSPAGDARIDATLDLSALQGKPCLAPAVLINPAPGAAPTADPTHYIAASGA